MSAIARGAEDSRPDAVRVEEVDASRWREAVERELRQGRRFLGLHGAVGREGAEVRCVFSAGHEPVILRSLARGGRLPTIVDLLPAASWDEREAHDAYEIVFDGHEPLRPLLDHDPDPASWTVPVRGHDPYQVAVGPIHAGVIESGHFRFHVVGERILHLDVRLFYKHRGLEQAAEGSDAATEGIRYAQRSCAGCAVTNSVAYAHAYEAAAGLWPDDALADVRTLLLELERLWNHLNDVSAICAGVGFAPGAMAFASLKERAQRLNERVSGHRFLFDTVAVGGSPLSLERDAARALREDLRRLRADSARYWRELLFNSSVQARLASVGTLTGEQARALGTVGPAARAAGIRYDRRQDSPRLGYAGFAVAAPSSSGDVAARLEQRAAELETTFDLLDQLLVRPLRNGTAVPRHGRASFGVGCVESPRGETVCVLELDGDRVGRLHLRSGSYANWPSVAVAAADNFLPDFPLINKSFELCYACADR